MEREAYTIDEFCRSHGFSRAHYFNMQKDGQGPRVMRAGFARPDFARGSSRLARVPGSCRCLKRKGPATELQSARAVHSIGEPNAHFAYDRVARFSTVLRTEERAGVRPFSGVSRQARWQAANPKARWAHVALQSALRRGLVEREPCIVCGALEVDGHHPDYHKPMDVTWLCRLHHMAEHRQARRGG